MMATYDKSKYELLKYKFNGAENILRNYSEAYQDMFVLTILDGKKEGYFVEIGAGNPIVFNNTYLLENEYNWNGISVEVDYTHREPFRQARNCIFWNADAMKINYINLFKTFNVPKQIDYLQIDIDPPPTLALDVLKKLPLMEYRASVITLEHNAFLGGECADIRNESRCILDYLGYELLVGNITNDSTQDAFEDWYIDKSKVSIDALNALTDKYNKDFNNKGENFLLK